VGDWGGTGLPEGEAPESGHTLRAKYLDFCSARIADILLRLSPEEMFMLAQDAARDSGLTQDLAWDQIVALATARVSSKLALPSFEEWSADYLRDPARYDSILMGLWRDELP